MIGRLLAKDPLLSPLTSDSNHGSDHLRPEEVIETDELVRINRENGCPENVIQRGQIDPCTNGCSFTFASNASTSSTSPHTWYINTGMIFVCTKLAQFYASRDVLRPLLVHTRNSNVVPPSIKHPGEGISATTTRGHTSNKRVGQWHPIQP